MRSLREWLLAPWDGTSDPFPPGHRNSPRHLFSPVPTRLEYLTAFLAMDRGGYGVMDGEGPYGMSGLDMDQAHSWWTLRAFVDGWLTGTGHAEEPWLVEALRTELARVLTLRGVEPTHREATP